MKTKMHPANRCRSAGLQPAVSQDCILRNAAHGDVFSDSHALLIANRRYGRLQTCATIAEIGQPFASNIQMRTLWRAGILYALNLLLISAVLAATSGCGTSGKKERDNEFFTSGSREADQRASQRMAKAEQLSGSGEGAGENDVKEAEVDDGKAAQAEGRLALYDRLGGEQGIAKIVDDFVTRALVDPRVNWQRKGIKRGGFSLHRNDSMTWNATSENIARLKKHMAQFFALTTGGPARYDGKEMKSAHADLKITNAEFDAAVGDLKASLDKLKIPNREQKELLAIVESTRPQVVEER